MTYQTKGELIKHYRKQYKGATKKAKSQILAIILEATGYSRKHAIALLNHPSSPSKAVKRPRCSRYAHLYETLRFVWAASNFICGKRLKPFLPEMLRSLKRHSEIRVSKADEALLLTASAATIDRLLAPARRQIHLKGRSTTKPGTLLKQQIPVRTFADWSEDKPGFLEVDLVAHCGETTRGEYINTLNMIDIATGWSVATAFMGRGERYSCQAIDEVKSSFPFVILGIDSDNGSEFINYHFDSYCKKEHITFTRSRPWKKNDSAHIEQKNWDVIRKMIGYGRFDTYEQLEIIRRIHSLLSLYQNYFQPSRKLTGKTRIGARTRRSYDTAQTPAQRLVSRKDTPGPTKLKLRDTFRKLNPVQLLTTINDLIHELYES
jgi:hypothetical protein